MREVKLALVIHKESFPSALTVSGIDWIWKEEVCVQRSYLPTSALDVYKTGILLGNHSWCDHFFLDEVEFIIHQLREPHGLPAKAPYLYSLPGPKVTIPFLILSAKRWIFEREASHLHNHIWNYPSASWTQHATVIEKIFIYFSHILSSLCQGKACLSCCQIKHCSNAHILLL